MTADPIICVHTGRSTWQGPASAAPRKEDEMDYDTEAAERLAEIHDECVTGTADLHYKTAALIRAQAAEIERLTARQPSPTPAPPTPAEPDPMDREDLVRLLKIITRNGSLDDGRTLHEVIADALLASGLRLPSDNGNMK